MVLLHGLLDSSVSWEPALPRLGQVADVLAPDLLGHGRSDKPRTDYSLGAHTNLLRDLLDVRGHDRVVLVGHSLGAGISMQFNYQYPGRCDALVMVAAGGLGRRISPWLRLASLPGVTSAIGLAANPPVRRGVRTVQTWAAGHERPQLAWALANTGRVLGDLGTRAGRDAYKNTLRGVVDHSGQRVLGLPKLHRVRALPTLIVWGADDRIIPVSQGHRAVEQLENGELAVIAGAGHAPHRSRPEQFAAVVVDFLRRHGIT